MSAQPLITVIMPAFNSASFIRRSLDSLKVSPLAEAEFLIVNDGSTDATPEIVNEYVSADPRFRLQNKSNGGYADAINHGLELCRGKYVLMMGSDDELTQDILPRLSNEISANDSDVIVFRYIFERKGEMNPDPTSPIRSYVHEKTTLLKFEKDHPIESDPLFYRDSGKLYKRSAIGNIRYEGKYGMTSDSLFSIKACLQAKAFTLLPVDGYIIHFHDDSVSSKRPNEAQVLERLNLIIHFFSFLDETVGLENYRLSEHLCSYINTWSDIILTHACRIPYKQINWAKQRRLLNARSKLLQRKIRFRKRIAMLTPRLSSTFIHIIKH